MKTLVITFVGGATLLHFSLTAPAQPVATTLAASSINSTNATLNGSVNPNGAPATAWFQFGLTTNYDCFGGLTALPATNTAQTLPGLPVNFLHGPAGTNWTQTSAPGASWFSIASSADGARLAAVADANGIYTSTNSGATWTLTSAPIGAWTSIASSADGTKLAATSYFDGIYTSVNGGVTWTLSSAPVTNWDGIASSVDGARLAAVMGDGGAYTSTNSGATWTQSSLPLANWNDIVSSADGSRLAAVSQNGSVVFTSTDGGGNWILNVVPAGTYLSAIASSADGSRLAATVGGGGIYLSADGGTTWTLSSAPGTNWASIARSADGTRLAAGANGGGIYASADSGATWTAANAPAGNWYSMTASTDGTRLAAVSYSGNIYTSTGQPITLAPATTYHYRVASSNSVGTSFGSDLTFTTSPGAPTATTLAASGINPTNATLNGAVNPNGAPATVYFQYGLTTNYGSYSATNTLAATNITMSVSNLISSLTPLTTYHFQLVASNSSGMTLGGDLTVSTPPLPPAVTTLAASNITTNKGTLNGTVNPNGAATTAWFQYGLTTNYGGYTATNSLAATSSPLSVSNLISGLAPGTTYHFQLVAVNSTGASAGNDLTFTTSAGAPTATTLPASGVTTTNATLNGTLLTGNLNTSAYFQYGFTTNYGSYSATNALAATNVSVSVSNLVSNLTPNKTYHFRLVARDSAGIALGADGSFTTVPLPPTVITLSASITQSNATLSGSVNPNGTAGTAYFQYGLTTNYDNLGDFEALSAANFTYPLYFVADASHGAAGATWTLTSAPATNWSAIASSADGSQLAAVVGNGASGGIYTSTDAGLTWTQQTTAPTYNWSSIASSADGSQLAAANSVAIYTSTDAGYTWIPTSAPSQSWQSIASSADGSFLAAVAQASAIYMSTNAGSDWTPTSTPAQNWQSIACSADGSRLVAVAQNAGAIYTSTNGGANWVSNAVPAQPWNRIACSADGTQLAATVYGGGIYLSTNSGSSWTFSSAPSANWASIACSADGTRLAAGVNGGGIYTSTNRGGTWTSTYAPTGNNWYSIASSADGSRLAAAANLGIYVSTGSVTPLTPGATYHYRAFAANAGGTSAGSDLTFIIPAPPTPTTLAATSVTSTNATLNGSVNPMGVATSAYIRYGLTTNYGSYCATNSLPATNVTFSLSNLISNLALATTYHFQLVAGNSLGTNTGADLTFTTSPELPVVTTLAATSITTSNATLNGSVNPKAAVTAAWFLHGLTTNYGNYTATNTLPATNSTLSLANSISNLPPGTAYHFKLVASNSVGVSLGNDLTFTTSVGAPMATTLPATSITASNATLNGSLFTGGSNSTAYFRYGLTTNYGSFSATNILAATNVTLAVSNSINGLAPATTYHFQLAASNSIGANAGADLAFTTGPAVPTATTLAATSLTPSNATLNGTVNPNGAATTAYFQFGLTTNYDNLAGSTALPATNTAQTLPGLIVNSLHNPAGTNWTQTTAPTGNAWYSIASSADGARLAAVDGPGGIYTSTNSGAAWTLTSAPSGNWTSIASSADGTRLAATRKGIGIYTSADGGVTWTQASALLPNWNGIASSADGTRLAAVIYGGGAYTSTNSGVTWTQSSLPTNNWYYLVSSADGSRLAAVAQYAGAIYTSTNGGGNWVSNGVPAQSWSAIASSADGTQLAAAAYLGGIYLSTNSGTTWTLSSAPTGTGWASIACSADGTRLAAGAYDSAIGIYTSTNRGATWTAANAPAGVYWYSMTASADGTRMAATVFNGGIYTFAGTISLVPGTTYHYRAVGVNSLGTGYGNDLAFTIVAQPTATPLPPTGITGNSAILNGSINPNGGSSTAYFRYGPTTNYGSYSATNALAATNVTLSVSNSISGLTPGTTYHFLLVAGNTAGTNTGNDLTFTTASSPVVTTLPPISVTSSNATLNGSINPNEATSTAYFRYGLTTNYGSYSATNTLAATNVTVPVSNSISGLTPGTTYHFKLVASNSLGTNAGADLAFTTGAAVPTATTLAATSITPSNATLNGTVNPNGAATAGYFQYGLTTNYDNLGGLTTLPATNTAQNLPALVVNVLHGPAGANWTNTSSPPANWLCIASAADGTHLAAGTYNGGIYTSANSGDTWTLTSAPNQYWQSIASSGDGTRLAAAVNGGGIYTSADGGVTWTQTTAPSASWFAIASSQDGSRLAAVVNLGSIYTSTNSGATWTQSSLPADYWYSIASSADGSRLAAVANYGAGIYTSTNGGGNWVSNAVPAQDWVGIASSADGTQLAAAAYGVGIYLSTNSGSTWTLSSAPSNNWSAIACSADGTRLAAGTYDSGIYTSTNRGATWTSGNGTTAYPWYSIGASADGTRMAAATYSGIYSSTGQAMSLASGMTCHYRAVGVNSIGTGYGNDLTFTTIAGPPTGTTLPASGITPTNATLNGSVTQNGSATSVYFRYGLTTNYGSFSATNNLPGTNLTLSVSNWISGLTLGTTYHFQLVATNTSGTSLANDLTFTTSPDVPTVTTLAATSITPSNATLNGTANPNAAMTTTYYQYGLTSNYDNLSGFLTLPATNTAQTLPGLVVNALRGPAGGTWTSTSAPNTNYWSSIASSADGTRLAAVVSGGGIYTSTNAGVTWTQTSASNALWHGIASSWDGSRLAAVQLQGYIYTSTNGGATWTPATAPPADYISIASSADGMRLAAAAYDAYNPGIFTSTNGAVSWTQSSAPAVNYNSIASSADGTRLAAVVRPGGIYSSTNAGVTWTQTSAPNSNSWYSITSSADGSRLAAVAYGGGIWVSTDGGADWTLTTAPNTNYWYSITSSFDGTRLAAGSYGVGIYTTTNSGATWMSANASTSYDWNSMAASADGTRLAATAYFGGIYTSTGQSNNLALGMTCHFRAVGLNSAGTGYGNDLAFTIAVPPTATTLPASGITGTNATLNGSINPNGAISTAYFRYGPTTNYGSYSATNTLAATNVTLSVSSLVGSLTPVTTYHFLLVAGNSLGTSLGNDLTFTTPNPPVATTLPPTSVTSSNATLNGTVNPDGAATTAYFQYGLTTNYDNFGGLTTLPATITAQTLPGLMVNSLRGPAGTNWTQTGAPATNWSSIASSADGTRLAAVVNGGGIYTSTNSGSTWTLTSAGRAAWGSIASSADGTKLAAVTLGGIYTSADGGVTWTPTSASAVGWIAIASSVDGSRLAAVVNGGGAYTSTDSGATWTQSSLPANNWTYIVSSADGSRLAAVAQNAGAIYTSTDGGANWVSNAVPSLSWDRIASSADGTQLAATAAGGGVYLSTNSGTTWTLSSAPGYYYWAALACSADGTRLAVGAQGAIYTSTNSGSTWTSANAPTGYYWNSMTASADGTRLAVAAYGGIYSSTGQTIGLAPGTTYHYRAVGVNSLGTGYGNDLAFTIVAPPTATTLPATGITGTGATLNGSINPNGGISTAYFLYGLTTNYGSYSATNTLAATNLPVSVSNSISGLTLGTTYHFLLVASNSLGTSLGNDLTFTTPSPPVVTTLPPTTVTSGNATLNGAVNPNGTISTAYFQYGLTTNYGSYSATNTLAATNITVSVSNSINGLTLGTTYHFLLVAGNSAGTNTGNDLTFATPSPPVVTTLPATSITPSNATLNGTANPNGAATTAYFQYGLTTNYDNLGGLTSLPATNTAQTLPGLIVNSLQGPAGTNWTQTTAPNGHWYFVASSADGHRLAAVVYGDGIYTSTNSGATWTLTSAPGTNWASIASSADGIRLAAAVSGGGIYTSADGGVTWTKSSAPSLGWIVIASSVDGSHLATVVNGGGAYTSTDSGVTWTQSSLPTNNWYYIVSSADGSRLVAVAQNAGGIYTSSNGGGNWVSNAVPSLFWDRVASSADGTQLAATVYGGGIYLSTNSGATWTLSSAPIRSWVSIACSADGSRLAAGVNVGGIYTSTNGGGTWTAANAPTNDWYSMAASADGTRLAAAAYGGGIYSSTGPAIGLAPGTTCHYRAVGVNSTGTGYGNDLTFTTSAATPAATTLAASGVTSSNATLNGNVTPNGAATAAYFRYGLTTNYGGYSATNNLAATNSTLSVSNLISSLTPGTIYHFQLVATNSVGTSLGNDLAFTTSAATPTPTTLPASGITSSNATLNGSVNPNGAITTAYFRYGLTTNYGSYSATNSLSATNGNLSVSNLIGNLTPGTTYHFQLVAANAAGTNAGADMQFTTPSQVAQAVSFNLNGGVSLPTGAFQFSFTNLIGVSFTVLATTDLTLPLTNWTVLGAPVEGPPGQYQFTDPQATNTPVRFYRVISP